MPLGELREQIGVVEKSSLFEERPFHPPDQVFDRSFLFRTRGPTELNPQAQIQHHTGKQGIPFRDLPALKATVVGRSKTAKSGIPPIAAK